MSEKNYLEKVRGEMGLLEKIMSYIPGYRGYKEKELRRESDRLVRMEAVNKLKSAKRIFRKKFANPLISQMLSEEDAYRFEAFLARLDRVTQRVDRAVAGYAGIFDAVKVREDKLDMVIQHDLGLMERVESIKTDVEKVAGMEVGREEWKNAMDELISKVEELDGFIDRRSEVIRGLSR
ncbi:MAG: hypothetical protein QXU95_00630 [Candidatus Bathyarchaeia archaeon]|nr:hypothetical protein [Candidatus Bathyarchaeota archaeon]